MFRLLCRPWLLSFFLLDISLNLPHAIAQTSPPISPPSTPGTRIYTPIPIPASNEVRDTLSDKDIPLGDGGFARDYAIQLNSGEQIAIDLMSDNFDTVVTLLTKEGKTIGKNDDGPDGTSNSLLFVRIKKTGTYTIRVQGFSETSGGDFILRINRLKSSP